jgi:hypothetical protein
MKKENSMILGYEDFFYAHHLESIPHLSEQRRIILSQAHKTARHLKARYLLNDEAEALIRSAILHAYLLGIQKKTPKPTRPLSPNKRK